MKHGLLNARAKYMLAGMGHRDLLGLADAGYNIPKEVDTVDLAVLPNIPTLMQVLDGILEEIPVEKIYLAQEIRELAPDILLEYQRRLPGVEFVFMPHTPEFDDMMHTVKGAIRTGQYNYHAPNCILMVGCEY